MHKKVIFVLVGVALFHGAGAFAADYVPPKGDAWTTHSPAQEGFDPAGLQAAIDFAVSAELKYPAENSGGTGG